MDEIIQKGKYKGKQWCEVPYKYLRFHLNHNTSLKGLAQKELSIRGRYLRKVTLSAHSVNRFFERYSKKYSKSQIIKGGGLYTFLQTKAREASDELEIKKDEEIVVHYESFIFVFQGIRNNKPILLTVY